MTSVLFLEQPGRWRSPAVATLLLVAAVPLAPILLWATEPAAGALSETFWTTLITSLEIAAAAMLVALTLGLPLGLLSALYDFPGRGVLLALVTLPLLVPPFLWALGWAGLEPTLPRTFHGFLRGRSGCVVVYAAGIVPLVLLITHAATRELSRSQIDAVRLCGGEARVLRSSARNAIAPVCLAAAFGGILSLSDPGSGQILGAHTAGSEVLTTFASHYDLTIAARQCLGLTAVVLLLSLPLAAAAGPRLAQAMLARQGASRTMRNRRGALIATTAFGLVGFFGVVLPIVGLVIPLMSGPWPFSTTAGKLAKMDWQPDHVPLLLLDALATLARTGTNTALYALGAGVIATALGFMLALAVGRSSRLRAISLAAALILLAFPPAASALGVAVSATAAPAWLDPLLRSRLSVCIVLGLRLFPLSAVFALRALATTPPSWAHAAALHGVPASTYLRRVTWPAVRWSAFLSVILVALLASADVGTVLLLHPPGESSFPLAIFTVMANAPESTVAALCLTYLAIAGSLLWAAFASARGER